MTELSRLRWQCRRGTRELDMLLENYLDHYYLNADSEERKCFNDFLSLENSELLPYLMMDKLPESEKLARLINKIQDHSARS